jgi:hypothetical protein
VAIDEELTRQRISEYESVLDPQRGIKDAMMGRALATRCVEATGEVVTVAWRQPEKMRLMLHLVNYKREPIEKNPGDHPIAQGPIPVDLPLPDGTKVKAVRLISPDAEGEQTLEFTQADGRLKATVPGLLVYSIVVVEFE